MNSGDLWVAVEYRFWTTCRGPDVWELRCAASSRGTTVAASEGCGPLGCGA